MGGESWCSQQLAQWLMVLVEEGESWIVVLLAVVCYEPSSHSRLFALYNRTLPMRSRDTDP